MHLPLGEIYQVYKLFLNHNLEIMSHLANLLETCGLLTKYIKTIWSTKNVNLLLNR
jgi:hypothetical protein